MGYYSRLFYSIKLDPPINNEELFSILENSWYIEGEYISKEKKATTEDGENFTVSVKYLSKIIGVGEGKMYDLEEELKLLAPYTKDSKCNGYLVRTGEDNSDIERYSFKDGWLVTERAKVIWPDGESVTGIY